MTSPRHEFTSFLRFVFMPNTCIRFSETVFELSSVLMMNMMLKCQNEIILFII